MRIRKGPRCQTDGVAILQQQQQEQKQQQQQQAATNLHSGATACGVNRRPQGRVENLGFSGRQEDNIVGVLVGVVAGEDGRTGDADLSLTAKAASLEHANGTSSTVTSSNLEEHDDQWRRRSRCSADNGGKEGSVTHQTDMGSTERKVPAEPADAESTMKESPKAMITSGANCCEGGGGPAAASAMDIQDQTISLIETLHHVCSASGNAGLTAREAVARINEQGLPGLCTEGGERLIVQVAKAFRNCAVFIQREERGRYFVKDASRYIMHRNFPVKEDSNYGVSDKAVNSSIGMMEAARQLQNLQKSHSKLQSSSSGMVVKPSRRFGSSAPDSSRRTQQNGETGHRNLGKRVRATVVSGRVSGFNKQKASPAVVDQSQPQCNRDDGKGWRCSRPAEAGFALCNYHRDQIRRAEMRRKSAKAKIGKPNAVAAAGNFPARYMQQQGDNNNKKKPWTRPKAVKIPGDFPISDDESPDQKRRKFIKAKSLKSLL